MDWRNEGVRLCGHQAIDLMIAGTFLDFSHPMPTGPKAGKEEQRAVLVEGEPEIPLNTTRLGVLVVLHWAGLREAGQQNDAAMLDANILLPVVVLGIADVGCAGVGVAPNALQGRRHPPPQIGKFALAIGCVADHRAELVGVDVDGRLEVAQDVAQGTGPLANCLLAGGDVVEVAHAPSIAELDSLCNWTSRPVPWQRRRIRVRTPPASKFSRCDLKRVERTIFNARSIDLPRKVIALWL